MRDALIRLSPMLKFFKQLLERYIIKGNLAFGFRLTYVGDPHGRLNRQIGTSLC